MTFNMRRDYPRLLGLLGAVGVLVTAVVVLHNRDRASVIAHEMAKAGLSPIPPTAHDVKQRMYDSFPDTIITLSFRDRSTNIKKWWHGSPGFARAEFHAAGLQPMVPTPAVQFDETYCVGSLDTLTTADVQLDGVDAETGFVFVGIVWGGSGDHDPDGVVVDGEWLMDWVLKKLPGHD